MIIRQDVQNVENVTLRYAASPAYAAMVAQAAQLPNGRIMREARRRFIGPGSLENRRELYNRVVAKLYEPDTELSFGELVARAWPLIDPTGHAIFTKWLKTLVRNEWVEIVADWSMEPTEGADQYHDDPCTVRSGGYKRVVENDSDEEIGSTRKEEMRDDIDTMPMRTSFVNFKAAKGYVDKKGKFNGPFQFNMRAGFTDADNAFENETTPDHGFADDERVENYDAVEQGYTNRDENRDPFPIYHPPLEYVVVEITEAGRKIEREVIPYAHRHEWKKITAVMGHQHRWSGVSDDGLGRWVHMDPLSEDRMDDHEHTAALKRARLAFDKLPPRLREYANLAQRGYRNDQIAAFMRVKPGSLTQYRKRVGDALRAAAMGASPAIDDDDSLDEEAIAIAIKNGAGTMPPFGYWRNHETWCSPSPAA